LTASSQTRSFHLPAPEPVLLRFVRGGENGHSVREMIFQIPGAIQIEEILLDPLVKCLERMTLALQSIDVSSGILSIADIRT